MITDNTGAKKIEGTDNWRLIFDAHNDSVDAHSQAIQKIEEGIAYRLGDTNTTGATLAVGTYVYVEGNTNGIANGMYKVSTAIVANGSLTTSNLTAVSGGIGNELNSKITNKNTFNTPLKTDSSSISPTSYSDIARKAFDNVSTVGFSNESGFVVQDSTGEVIYCLVLRRGTNGVVFMSKASEILKIAFVSGSTITVKTATLT